MGVNGHWYVEIEKQAFWRGSPHTWVNRYVMSGSQPSASDAESVITALHGIEDTLYPHVASGAGIGFVIGKAYPSGAGPAYAVVDYNTDLATGTSTGFTGPTTAYVSLVFSGTLENSVVIETKLQALSSTGKPTFLRKYMRGLTGGVAGVLDGAINSSDVTTIEAKVLPWKTGVGASSWVVIGNSGSQAAAAPVCLGFVGNRQVPKGRKKKKASASILSTLGDAAVKGLLSGAVGLASDGFE